MTEIRISGDTDNLNYEYYVILQALKNAGLRVIEDNAHPIDNPVEYTRKVQNRLDNVYDKDWYIKLSANHKCCG
jgi:hypothetical protein